MNPPRGCLLVSFGATRPPYGNMKYRGPSTWESGQYSGSDRSKIVYPILLPSNGRKFAYTVVSSSLSSIRITSPISGYRTARRTCSARFCPSSSRSYSDDVLAISRLVSGARQLGTKYAEQISRIRESTFSASDSARDCTVRTEQGVSSDGVALDRSG